MNYYNPYINFIPYVAPTTKTGLLSGLLKPGKFSLNSILNGTQKTLNFINQTIPIVKQVSPMVKNAKTMFKVMNEFKKSEKNTNVEQINTPTKLEYTSNKKNNDIKIISNENEIEKNNGLTFFI